MTIDTIPKKWDTYEYDIQVTFSNGNKMCKIEPMQIQSLIIEKDFDNQILPIVILEIIKQESIDVPIDNNTEVILSINSFIMDRDNAGKVKRKKQKRTVMRDIFCVIRPDVVETDKLRHVSQKKNRVKKNELTPEDMSTTHTYTLFRKSDLISSKFIFNAILSKTTMQQAIAALLSKSGIKKVLMSNLDFVDTIDELILMPIGLIKQLQYLKNYYGWHKEDTTIFMDIDCMYLTRMSGTCSAWRSGESKIATFYINAIMSGDNFNGGMAFNGNNLYVNVASDQYEFQDLTGVNEQITGTNTILFNEDSASSSIVSGVTTNTISSTGTTNVKSSSGHNKYLENWIKCRNIEQSGVIAITCNNIDFSQLTPNKEYRLISKQLKITKKVQGTYRLSKITTVFGKDGNDFIEKSVLELRKTM